MSPLKRTPPQTKSSSASTFEIPHTGKKTAEMESVQAPGAVDELNNPATNEHDSARPGTEGTSDDTTFQRRFKRKFYEDSNSGNMETIMGQMRSMFDTFSRDQAARFKDLQDSVSKIEKQNDGISKTVDFLSQRYDEILETVKELKEDKIKDKKHIQELEEKVELLERKLKGPAIEIRNLPKQLTGDNQHETKEKLCEIVKHMGQAIKVEIKDADIKDIFTIKSKVEDKKTMFAEFTSVIKKEQVVDAVLQFNKGKKNSDKLNGSHLKLNDAKTPIYVSEALTRNGQKLLYAARQFVKNHGLVYAWSYRGAIYLRKAENQKPIKINSEADLKNISIPK
ncbi:uncharacterized protein LOC133532940 [Cydia pomonella]|uniref:uncharacterized protein LOC133532940 n=1 Tax=Cydia pomonella TaxID=82600 RepID=UPI002ADD6A45|nr:uncharacterized protein LOC133532940 [Cydia pomonella]